MTDYVWRDEMDRLTRQEVIHEALMDYMERDHEMLMASQMAAEVEVALIEWESVSPERDNPEGGTTS